MVMAMLFSGGEKRSGFKYFNHTPQQGHGAALFSVIDGR
jgi:hypothetical protein